MMVTRRAVLTSVAGSTVFLSGCVRPFQGTTAETPSGPPSLGDRRILSAQHAATVKRAETADTIVYGTLDGTTELDASSDEQFLLVEVRIAVRRTAEDRLIEMPNANAFDAVLEGERISAAGGADSTNDILEPIEGGQLSTTARSSGRPGSSSFGWLVYRVPDDSTVDEIKIRAQVDDNDSVTWLLSA